MGVDGYKSLMLSLPHQLLMINFKSSLILTNLPAPDLNWPIDLNNMLNSRPTLLEIIVMNLVSLLDLGSWNLLEEMGRLFKSLLHQLCIEKNGKEKWLFKLNKVIGLMTSKDFCLHIYLLFQKVLLENDILICFT